MKGQECYFVPAKETKGKLQVSRGAGISTRNDTPDYTRMNGGVMDLNRNIAFVSKNSGGMMNARQRKMEAADRAEGRR